MTILFYVADFATKGTKQLFITFCVVLAVLFMVSHYATKTTRIFLYAETVWIHFGFFLIEIVCISGFAMHEIALVILAPTVAIIGESI
jgi:hypothetical protein